MIPVSYKMVDLGGLDLATINGDEVPGIYEKVRTAYETSRIAIFCNWFFAGILIVPSYVLIALNDTSFIINDTIIVQNDDTIYIPGISPSANIEELNVTENGEYTPPLGVDGYAPVNVEVPDTPPVLEELTVTENGDYYPTTGYDGFSQVSVDVSCPTPVLVQLTATQNGHYTPGQGEDGFSSVDVSVQPQSEFFTTVQDYKSANNYSKVSTANATYISYTVDSSDAVTARGMVINSNGNNVRISFVTSNPSSSAALQAGYCQHNATLPDIIGSGTGRVDYTNANNGGHVDRNNSDSYYIFYGIYSAAVGERITVIIEKI